MDESDWHRQTKRSQNTIFGSSYYIIMDDISGVADISKNLANFLTVSRKSG